jgi:hypothetical protein
VVFLGAGFGMGVGVGVGNAEKIEPVGFLGLKRAQRRFPGWFGFP